MKAPTPVGLNVSVVSNCLSPSASSCLQNLYVCGKSVSPLLGRDFMRNNVYARPAHNAVYQQRVKIPAFDLAVKVRNRVALISSITLRPLQETVAAVEGLLLTTSLA